MSIENELHQIELHIDQLQSALQHERAKIWGEGMRPQLEEPGYVTFVDQMERFKRMLDLKVRQLRSIDIRIDGEARQNNGAIPKRGYGYRATLKQYRAQSERTRAKAKRLVDDLKEILWSDFGVPIPARVEDLKESLLAPFKASVKPPASSEPIVSASPSTTIDWVLSVSVLVGILIHEWAKWQKSKKEEKP